MTRHEHFSGVAMFRRFPYRPKPVFRVFGGRRWFNNGMRIVPPE